MIDTKYHSETCRRDKFDQKLAPLETTHHVYYIIFFLKT